MQAPGSLFCILHGSAGEWVRGLMHDQRSAEALLQTGGRVERDGGPQSSRIVGLTVAFYPKCPHVKPRVAGRQVGDVGRGGPGHLRRRRWLIRGRDLANVVEIGEVQAVGKLLHEVGWGRAGELSARFAELRKHRHLAAGQVFGVHLTIGQQLIVVIMSVVTAIGVAGIPGGSIPLLMMVLGMVGVPMEGIAIILGVVWLVRDGIDLRRRPPEETALTILDRRFAEGTLSLDDYRHRRDVLTGAAVPHLDIAAHSPETERREQ